MQRWVLAVGAFAALVCATGCRAVVPQQVDLPLAPVPRNDRPWQANLAKIPFAEFDGDEVTIHNVRQTVYLTADDYIVRHRTEKFSLDDVVSVDLMVCPFPELPSLAHTMLSFGLHHGKHLVLSVEARLEEGETYSPVDGMLDRFELIYVIADEKDPVLLRTKYRGDPVLLFPLNLTPAESRRAFEDALAYANKLKERPEFYNTLSNNCTTGILRHIEAARPTGILFDPRIVFTGLTDRVAYDFGLVADSISYEHARRRADITELANRYAASPLFSQRIRIGMSASQVAAAVASSPGNR